ncbi:hypothetical protein LRAMOSA07559 [Lichtheimia ramosa]|uniref:Protein kinase domain-containing protein n=1 Tax=Lichtheimia ramosa TaxID=688394 RepID=A0A077WC99_9FUNG|nr:hypothetical protein LRAMOSA07559 [Lichtheimia ramosa]
MTTTVASRSMDELQKHDHFFDGRYEKLYTLGRGNFGKVYIARECKTGKQVAVKVIDKRAFRNEDQRQHANNEKAICEGLSLKLRHKNVVDVYEVQSDHANIFVAMEYVDGGELFDKIKQKRRLEEPLARRWFREIIEAVAYIHRNGIVHRDLKPENVLIDKYQTVRICDFGFGKFCERQQVLNTYCGSPFYAAPEMVTATPYQGPPVDMWSCGVILYAMLAGTLPFQGQDMPQLFRRINSGQYTLPEHISKDAANLIERLLCKNAKHRITAEECLKHPWLVQHIPAAKESTTQPLKSTSTQNTLSLSSQQQHTSSCLSCSSTTTTSSPSAPCYSHTTPRAAPNKRSKASRIFSRMFTPTRKAQIAPSSSGAAADGSSYVKDEDQHTTTASSKNKFKRMEGKVALRLKGFLKTAFQRRIDSF